LAKGVKIMQRVHGIPQPQTEPAGTGEVRWIERLQQQPAAPVSSNAVDGAEAGAWIRRLQQRAGNRAL
jgi:hypothetical protein